MDLKAYVKQQGEAVNRALESYMAFASAPFELLAESMAYSLFAGGKRVRPVLTLAACDAVGGKVESAMPYACALEMIHTYSLIHDDMPCMDDDVLRRGRATNHIVYGEAQALLAGNSLLTLAYEICLDAATKGRVPFDVTVKALADISHAVGVMGVMGGQSLDVSWAGRRLDLEQIETVCHHKTGTLIATSVRCGAIVGGGTPQQIQALSRYGTAIGLAFQVADDILNVVGDAKTLGKSTGTDDAMGKSTFPALLGLDGATKKAESLLEQALDALSDFGDEALPLREIARYIVHRDH